MSFEYTLFYNMLVYQQLLTKFGRMAASKKGSRPSFRNDVMAQAILFNTPTSKLRQMKEKTNKYYQLI